MTRYVLKRLVLLPALLFLFSVTVFAIVQAPPGDFLTTYVATLASSGSSISAEQVEALRREYGLDQPVWIQYLKWMENLAKGNLGLSLEYQRPNAELIGERLVLTMVLAMLVVRLHLGRRHPGRHLLGDAPALGRRLRDDRHQLRGRRHAQLHAGARSHVGRLRVLRHLRHGALLARLRGRAVERGARARSAQARVAPGGRARRGRDRAAHAGDARQSARRAQ